MDKNTIQIGIIGGGFVGQILKQYYPQATVYDINTDRSIHPLSQVMASEVLFICVNFQDNCLSNTSKDELDKYFDWYYGLDKVFPKFIIVKSTFAPGTLDRFQNKYPHLKFVYNPEFLTERTAWEDFTNPQFQILGTPYQSLPYVKEIFELLPPAQFYGVISPLDAEILKHAFNSYYATKVIFFNQLFDACQKLGADYETIRQIMVRNSWIGDSHSLIWHKGYRGYGEKCLPKDTESFAKVSGSELLTKVIEINERLRHNQKM